MEENIGTNWPLQRTFTKQKVSATVLKFLTKNDACQVPVNGKISGRQLHIILKRDIITFFFLFLNRVSVSVVKL